MVALRICTKMKIVHLLLFFFSFSLDPISCERGFKPCPCILKHLMSVSTDLKKLLLTDLFNYSKNLNRTIF